MSSKFFKAGLNSGCYVGRNYTSKQPDSLSLRLARSSQRRCSWWQAAFEAQANRSGREHAASTRVKCSLPVERTMLSCTGRCQSWPDCPDVVWKATGQSVAYMYMSARMHDSVPLSYFFFGVLFITPSLRILIHQHTLRSANQIRLIRIVQSHICTKAIHHGAV